MTLSATEAVDYIETESQPETAAAAEPAAVPGTAQEPVAAARRTGLVGAPGNSPYSVRLEFFAGPMDLLLHLVHQQEVPIERVQMSVIAEQYLEIVTENAALLDLEKASEYLVIAATLLAIKSRSLLPSENCVGEDEQSDAQWFDQRFFEDLRERISAYELTKSRALALIKLPQLGVDTFARNDRSALRPTPEMLAEPEESHTLGTLFARLVARVGLNGPSLRIALEPVSVVSMMMKIVDALGAAKGSAGKEENNAEVPRPADEAPRQRRSLGDILRSFIGAPILQSLRKAGGRRVARAQVRSAVIGSFCGMLELVKRGVLAVSEEDRGLGMQVELRLSQLSGEADIGELESEFDAPAGDARAEREHAAPAELEHAAAGGKPAAKVVDLAQYRSQDAGKRAGEGGGRATMHLEDEGGEGPGEAGSISNVKEAGNV